MKNILSYYGIDRECIIILPVKINSNDFEFDNEDFDSMNEMFWEN